MVGAWHSLTPMRKVSLYLVARSPMMRHQPPSAIWENHGCGSCQIDREFVRLDERRGTGDKCPETQDGVILEINNSVFGA